MLATIDKNERLTGDAVSRNPAGFFRFQFEDRVECVVLGKVRYSKPYLIWGFVRLSRKGDVIHQKGNSLTKLVCEPLKDNKLFHMIRERILQ